MDPKMQNLRSRHGIGTDGHLDRQMYIRIVGQTDSFLHMYTLKGSTRTITYISEEFSEKYRYLLFGDVTDEEAFNVLDIDGNGKIQYHELMNFVENSGVKIRQRFLGYHRKDINGLFSFLDTLQTTVLTNVKRVFVGEDDLKRTVGINTGHVGTSDFQLEKVDREFVVQQGRNSTYAFLQYYVAENEDRAILK